MRYKFKPRTKPSEITSSAMYKNRRQFMRASTAAGLSIAAAPLLAPTASLAATTTPITHTRNDAYTNERGDYGEYLTPKKKALSYNNFYELGTDKGDPADNNHLYEPAPWKVQVDGEVQKPGEFDLDDLYKLAATEERVYRLRCVEAWSMVIPWLGFSLSHLLNAVQPTGNAKYVNFLTFDPTALFPDDANRSLPWPYSEGMRMDEAMHPLTLLTFGMYGETLSTQNGAPVRIILPWKYGFKSGKALTRITLTEKRPVTTWNILQPAEYGFYANVNPKVSHPRWGQDSERAITDSFLPTRRPTDFMNGFADEVASLYADMDLHNNY